MEELKSNRARKLKARAKYEEFVRLQQQQQQKQQKQGGCGGDGGGVGLAAGYARWDLWCPSDEEDELFAGLVPEGPAFRAMARDIDERHAR